jgi:hypothetical protein
MRSAWLFGWGGRQVALVLLLAGCTSRPDLRPKFVEQLAVPPDEERYSQPTKYPAADRGFDKKLGPPPDIRNKNLNGPSRMGGQPN